MDKPYKPISCELHDYLEVACLYSGKIRLVTDNESLVVKAITIETRADKTEWLVCEVQREKRAFRLDTLVSLEQVEGYQPLGKVILKG